jgi:hypothetical protein
MPKRATCCSIRTGNLSAEEISTALTDDLKVERILREARMRPFRPMVTAESIRRGAAYMAEFRAASERVLQGQIKRNELITEDELIERLGGTGVG